MRKKEKGEIPMEMPGYMLVSWCRSLGASIRFPCIRIHNMHPASIGSEIREFHALENAEAKFRNECEEKWTSEPKTSALLDCPGVHCDIEGRPRIIYMDGDYCFTFEFLSRFDYSRFSGNETVQLPNILKDPEKR